MDSSLTCPKCKSQMESGFIVDSGPMVSSWVAGPPKLGFLILGFLKTLKIGEVREITTYRCTGCNYLESYASTGTKKYL